MALDGIFLYSIADELKNKLLGGKVEKINQPEKDEIIISIKNMQSTYRLLISASPVYPRIHITESAKSNPLKAPMFCMLLRKYLNNARIMTIRQLETDRVLFIDFESLDELGFNSIYTLTIEIMGRHSNITLVRSRDNIIMDSIKHVTPDINSFRCLYSGIEYVMPPKSGKLNPFESDAPDFINFIEEHNLQIDKNIFSSAFTGVSSQLSKEIFYRVDSSNNIDKIGIFDTAKNVFQDIYNKDFHYSYYKNNGLLKDFYCIKLLNMNSYEEIQYDSPSKLLEDFYYEKDKMDRLNSRSSDLQKIISTNLDRCSKKIDILQSSIEECKDADKYKLYGELLTANMYNIERGKKEVSLLNYYSENGEQINIPLNENKSPTENAQFYYKKYSKLKKSAEAAKIQINNAKEELEYLQSVLTNIKNAEDYETIEDCRKELVTTGYIKFKKDKAQKSKPSKPLHFISSDGIDIYVGKNNTQNDYLTLKFADKHDTWLHTKNIPGSHVIIKKFGDIPQKTLMEAAELAAHYSKAKDSSKIPVDYTEVKNVHKPNGAKPGMVIYYTNSTIYVTPDTINLKQL